MSEQPRGVLHPKARDRWFTVSRRPASPELADLVEYHWTVRWDLRGRGPYVQPLLTEPVVHLAIERARSVVVGVATGSLTRLLEGHDWVFGIKFRPAGFRPLLGSAVAALTNRTVGLSAIFGADGEAMAERIRALHDDVRMARAAEEFIHARRVPPDPMVPVVNDIVVRITEERQITRVADVVNRTGIGERRLRRLFAEYVGVHPKWVIQRYRLHEAAERLASDEGVDLAALALELGYFDQAHFARDFRAIVGRPPASYARTAGSAPDVEVPRGRRR
jgi:AraC-like DNA-binding protein